MGNDRLRRHCAAIAAGLLAALALPPLGLPPLLWLSLAVLWGLALPGGSAQRAPLPRGGAGSPGPAPQAAPGLRPPPVLSGLVPRPRGPSSPFPRAAWPLTLVRAAATAAVPPAQESLPVLPTVVSPTLPALAGVLPEGLLWGAMAVLLSHRWLLWLHPLDWIGVPGPLSLPLCLLLWLLIGLAGGLLVSLWLALMRRLGPARLSTALIGASLWGLAEVLLAGGPLFWIGLGSAALPGDPAMAGLAAVGGAGLLAALQLLLGWGLWRTVTAPRGRRPLLLGSLALVLAVHLAGLATLAAVDPQAGAPERVMVLQPAIPTRRKFEAGMQVWLLRQLSQAQRVAGSVARILVLPEGSLALGQPLPEPATVEVLSGGFRQEGVEQRSSLLRFAPGEVLAGQWLDKHRLVPLGEWVPGGALLRWSGLSAVGGLQGGAPSRLLRRPDGPVAVAICYEVSDGRALALATRRGGEWLLASANLDPYPSLLQHQFTALARLRAIESGRWLVSAANTGPSLAVDARGAVRIRLPAGRPARAAVEIHRLRAHTPYVRWGEGPLVLLLLTGVALHLRRRSPVPPPASGASGPQGAIEAEGARGRDG